MTREQKIKLVEAGTPQALALLDIAEFNYTGYAGVLPNGNIVDRRLNPEAYPVAANSMFGIPAPKELELKPYDIWMEGYAITGNSSGAQKINEAPILAYSFDHAVQSYMAATPKHGIKRITPQRYADPTGYIDRPTNWEIWGCALYDNEAQARKSFG